MKISRRNFWLVCLVALLVPVGGRVWAQATTKVIIYPAENESIDSLKARGITKADDFRSCWVAQVTDAQLQDLQKVYGKRLEKADRLNKLELRVATIDTRAAEPPVPQRLKQSAVTGQRLRLIQFIGPIQPEWLTAVTNAGKVKLVNYVPNDGYLVQMDAASEARLQAQLQPAGPIQWIGSFHAYYKLHPQLVTPATATVEVYVAVLNSDTAQQTIDTVRRYALKETHEPTPVLNQINLQVVVRGDDVAALAQLPDVLWVDPVKPTKKMDEAQAIVLATGSSGPSPSRYLDFLLNKVGFATDPSQYPVLDIADSGLDEPSQAPHCFASLLEPWHPAFYIPSFPVSPNAMCCGYTISRVVYNDAIDTDGHGTIVASVAAGYDTLPDELINCYTQGTKQSCKTNVTLVCTTNSFTIGCGVECSGPNPPVCCLDCSCTNYVFTCGYVTNVVCTNICTIIVNKPSPPFPVTIYRQDFFGLQLGLGVSPYGRIGASLGGAAVANFNAYNHGLNAYLRQARISNNSWGEVLAVGSNDGQYDALAQAYDVLTRDAVQTGQVTPPPPGSSPVNQELTYIFAGGNANGVDGTGGFGDVLVTPPATAKNVITVGASTKTSPGSLASFTSFGPCSDGRIKPDIMAPGVDIYGATSQASYIHPQCGGCDPNNPSPPPCTDGFALDGVITRLYSDFDNAITVYSGTSFSAPAVSGGAQLLWWYFQNRLLMYQPSPAMTKAYICNAAQFLPNTDPLSGQVDQLPSPAQGMGRMDLDRMFDGVPRVLRDESTPRAIDSPLLTTNPVPQQTFFSAAGQSYEVSGTVFDPTKPFRVTLAWSDAPGSPVLSNQLVNNLDLQVTVGGQSYQGNIFDRQYSTVDVTRPLDNINNMESVFLPGGQTGTWKVVVRAINIAGIGVPNVKSTTLGQDFALVVYNAANPSDAANLTTNNSCQTAKVILQYPFAWTNNLTTAVYGKPNPSPSVGRGGAQEFFKIGSPTPGTTFTASTAGSLINTVLSVWKGTCGGLAEVTSSLNGTVTWTVDEVTTYFIVVEGRQNATGKVVLKVLATPPPFSFDTAVLDFGSVLIGATSNRTTSLHNGTGSPVYVEGVSITGANADDFQVTQEDCSGTFIPVGTNCDITVQFAPGTNSVGARTAQLVVSDNVTGGPHVLTLTGIGLPQAPVICATVNGLAFGATTVGTTSVVQSITFTNCGTAPLVVTNVVLGGAAPADFVVTNLCGDGSSVAPGDACTINVAFAPTTNGSRLATLQFVSNVAGAPPVVTLSGTGVLPTPRVCLSATSLAFGNQGAGTTSAVPLSVTVTNCGTKALNITSVSLSGPNAGEFVLGANTCLGSLTVSSGCSIAVSFAPTNLAVESASLIISNDSAVNPVVVSLTGNGTGSQPDLFISKSRNIKRYLGRGLLTPPTPILQQTLLQKSSRGAKRVYFVAFQNAGNSPDSFLVQGDPGVDGVYTVQYFLGAIPRDSLDVTDVVVSGTFTTANLAPGSYTGDATLLRVEIRMARTVPRGTTATINITGASVANPSKVDTVEAVAAVR